MTRDPQTTVPTVQPSLLGNSLRTALIGIFIAIAGVSDWEVITHSQASTNAIEDILKAYNMKNEGEKAVDQYAKKHPLLGFFVSSPIKHQLELSSKDESAEDLGPGVSKSFRAIKTESAITAWWSCFLINFSLFFVALGVLLDRSFGSRFVILALTLCSLSCFIVGILAPVMVIWTAPVIPMETGPLSFVVQHEIRGIAAIIYDLFDSGHWTVGGFLLLFSIMTPITKAILTIFVTISRSASRNYKVGQFLHTIGKWSMADVMVAGILLSLYALKFQEATKSIPCIGLYYFAGYCLVSLSTTELLVRSSLVSELESDKPSLQVGMRTILALFVLIGCFAVGSSAYAYQQYTLPEHEKTEAPSSPEKLNSKNLALPGAPTLPPRK